MEFPCVFCVGLFFYGNGGVTAEAIQCIVLVNLLQWSAILVQHPF